MLSKETICVLIHTIGEGETIKIIGDIIKIPIERIFITYDYEVVYN